MADRGNDERDDEVDPPTLVPGLRQELIALLPGLEAPGPHGSWSSATIRDGVVTEPIHSPSKPVYRFMKAVYDFNILIPFDWGEWSQTPEALKLRDKPRSSER